MKFESLINEKEKGFLDSFRNIVPAEIERDVLNSEEIGFPALIAEALSAITDSGGSLFSFFLFVLGAAALIAAASFVSERFSKISELGIMLIVGTALFAKIRVLVLGVCEMLGGVLNFCTAFLPIMAGAVAYGGGVGAAATGAAGANMTLGIIGTFVLPLMSGCASLIFSLGLLGIGGSQSTAALSNKVKNFFMWLAGICSVLLLSSLALQSAIASSADNAVMRAAKYAASSTIPIVGGAVSSAMGALGAGASYIKSTLGLGALSVILLLTLSPLAELLICRFIISVGESILDFLGISFGSRLFSSFRAALDVLIAVFVLSVSVLFLEIVILMKSGVGAL